jgi:hypothetical protein
VPVLNASHPPSLTPAPASLRTQQTATTPPATPGAGSEGEVQVVEDLLATEQVGTPEWFPLCTPALEAEMVPCEVPESIA